jgi:hypothetical protein
MRLHLLRPTLLHAVLAGCLADPNAAPTLVAALTTALAATKRSKSEVSARRQKQRLTTLARLAGPAASTPASTAASASSAAAGAAAAAAGGGWGAASGAEGSTDAVAASQTALLDALREKRRRTEAMRDSAAAAVDPVASEPADSSVPTSVNDAVGVGWTRVRNWQPCAIGMLPSDSLCAGTVPPRSPPRSSPPPPAATSVATALAPTVPLEATEAATVGGLPQCMYCGRGGHRAEETASAAATALRAWGEDEAHDSSESESEGEPQPKRAALARRDGQDEPGQTADVGAIRTDHNGEDVVSQEAEVVATAPSMRLGGGWAALAPDSIAYMQNAMQSF